MCQHSLTTELGLGILLSAVETQKYHRIPLENFALARFAKKILSVTAVLYLSQILFPKFNTYGNSNKMEAHEQFCNILQLAIISRLHKQTLEYQEKYTLFDF